MNYKTTGNRVLIEREPTETKTSSGLIVPKLGEESNYYGYVVQTGPGKTTKKDVLIEMSVQVGDKVLFDPNGAIPVTVDGRDLLVVKEDDIVSVVDANTNRGIL
jgi:chaperonin GroES